MGDELVTPTAAIQSEHAERGEYYAGESSTDYGAWNRSEARNLKLFEFGKPSS
jgi:hypothetical protein